MSANSVTFPFYPTVQDMRDVFVVLKAAFPNGNAPNGMLEMVGTAFVADQDTIFGEPNEDYIEREILWYDSESLNIHDMKPPIPQIWRDIARPDGTINSNYGYLLYSQENGAQFDKVYAALRRDINTRQAIAIYTRPSIHVEAGRDFICTNTVQYVVRHDELHVIVNMRSNDVVFGYRNDYAWQRAVQIRLCRLLSIDPGDIFWQTGSLHVYPRHFGLVK